MIRLNGRTARESMYVGILELCLYTETLNDTGNRKQSKRFETGDWSGGHGPRSDGAPSGMSASHRFDRCYPAIGTLMLHQSVTRGAVSGAGSMPQGRG